MSKSASAAAAAPLRSGGPLAIETKEKKAVDKQLGGTILGTSATRCCGNGFVGTGTLYIAGPATLDHDHHHDRIWRQTPLEQGVARIV